MQGPVVQDSRIKIRSTGPDERVHLRVDYDGGEPRRVAEGSVDPTLQHWLQVDLPSGLVIEADP